MKNLPWFMRGRFLHAFLFYGFIAFAFVFLILFAVPSVSVGPVTDPKVRARLQLFNNARQIQFAAANEETGGWPGDLKDRGAIRNLSDFADRLVRQGALKAADLKLFAGPGFKAYQGDLDASGHLSPPFTDENCAFRIYWVRKTDPPATVFLRSKPMKDNGIVIMRKSGDGTLYKTPKLARTALGDPAFAALESPANCLNP